MDIKPGKGMTVNESNEHQRKWSDHAREEQKKRREYDPTREHLNFEIAKGGIVQSIDKSKTIPQRMAERLRACGIKDPNEGLKIPTRRTLIKVIFQGNHDRMVELAFGNQDVDLTRQRDNSHIQRMPEIEQWALDQYRFACEQWGEDNIVGFYVHLDEKCPHIHCSVLPITPDNKLSYKKVMHSNSIEEARNHMHHLHDELAKVNAKWGLERGSDIRKSGAVHCSPDEYRRQLARQVEELLGSIKSGELTLDDVNKRIASGNRKMKSFTTMIANLKTRKAELTKLHDDLLRQFNQADADKSKLESELAKTEKELSDVNAKLTNRQIQLAATEQEVDALTKHLEELRTKSQEMKAQLESLAGDYKKQLELHVRAAMTDELASTIYDVTHFSDKPDARNAFDNTYALEFANRTNEIVNCALLLTLGYVDQATTFAESHGGGGSGSDMPWGRREDEDDRNWMMRCLKGAARMMHPRGGQKKKR